MGERELLNSGYDHLDGYKFCTLGIRLQLVSQFVVSQHTAHDRVKYDDARLAELSVARV
jgi:hypothetical protein